VANGIITTIAGGGTSFADNIPATSAELGSVGDIAVDTAGSLCITNSGAGAGYSREVMNGTITTFNNSPGTVSSFAADNSGNLYFSDYGQVQRISNGVATIVAGNGDGSYIGDGTVATNAGLATPNSVAVDRAGNVYIADSGNQRIRRVTGGQITTIATTTTNPNQCGGCPGAVAVDGSGNVYFANGFQVRVISNGVITTVAGNGSAAYSGDGGPATSAGLFPTALAVDSQNDLYIADVYRIRKVSQGVITTVAGNGAPCSCATPVLATGASMANVVGGLSIDSSGNIYFTNTNGGAGEVCRVSNGIVTSVANSSTPGFRNPLGVALDQLGNVFIVSPGNVWKLSNGVLTNIAGTPSSFNVLGYSGDGGPGTSATLGTMNSSGLALDIAGNIYVADNGNNRVRILSPTGFGNPIGSFDTPLDNSTGVAGAIPVTGWALDNVGVAKVEVWREPAANEPGPASNLIFVGDAVQIAGARPDVQALYPNMPFNDRAGWGYMLLTNFLPGVSGPLGNGTYKLHAIATNNAGAQTDLGTRTIVVDNVHTAKPFGTIDTPGQGDTISGNAYVNFGWALTQNPYCIPVDGHTIAVYVDGLPVGNPTYNQDRADIATLFPGLCNSTGAIGCFYIDTPTLTNGVHTIAWVASDNQGRQDGLGSRYFTVQNSGSVAASQAQAPVRANTRATARQRDSYSIEIEEMDRIELDLGAISGGPLPIGSTLKDGSFYWQLGPGFLGEYQFRFTQADGSSALVRVKVHPKSYNQR
jgi:NHL repeat